MHHYAKYFSIPLNNDIISLCDNKAYVKTLKIILKDQFYLRSIICENENEVYTLINTIIPNHYSIEHIYSYHDDSKTSIYFNTKWNLNTEVDSIAVTHPSEPIHLHFLFTVIVIYIDKRYIHYNIDNIIGTVAHAKEIRFF